MSSSEWGCMKSVLHTLFAFSILFCDSSQVSNPNAECMEHLSSTGIDSKDVSSDGYNVTFRYYLKRDDLLVPDDGLYTLQWDDNITPLETNQDLRFDRFFEVEERNQSLKVSVKKASLQHRNFSRILRAVESRLLFGHFLNSTNCMVILRHYFTDLYKHTKPSSNPLGGNLEKGNTKGTNTTEISCHGSCRMTKDHLQSSSKTFHKALPQVSDNTFDDDTTVSLITVGEEEESNLQVTVGIIGGVLGLLFLIGVGVAIYYNYKKGVRLGFFRRQQKSKKTITTLGSIYPNVCITDSEMREKVVDPEDPASRSPYPNYAYANPAATEPVPPNHRLI